MKSTDITREQNIRRRDIGSGVYWELLGPSFLELIFNSVMRPKILALFNGGDSSNLDWSESEGIMRTGSSQKFAVLVATPDSCNKMHQFIERHGGFSSIIDKLTDQGQTGGMQEAIIDLFQRHVRLGRVVSFSDLSKFKAAHGLGTEPATHSLVSEHTVDTGRAVALDLKSVPRGVDRPVRAPTNRKYIEAGRGKKMNGRLGKTKATLDWMFKDKESKDPYVTNVHVSAEDADQSDEFVHVDREGRLEVYRQSEHTTSPAFSVGGKQDNIRTPGIQDHQWGSRKHSYATEGTMDNPAGVAPGSFFNPNPSVLSSLLSPINSFSDNPALLLGLMALLMSQEQKSTHYFTLYHNLPLRVIDNEEVEQELFGGQ